MQTSDRPKPSAGVEEGVDLFLECTHICKYFGGLRAVDGVSFSVEEAEIAGLIGPNGAGKTTLFNVIAGLYKPTSGSVVFRGQKISGLNSPKICKKGVGRTFQVPQPFHGMTVLENIMVAHYFGKPENRRLGVPAIIDLIGLKAQEEDVVDNLTIAGQKRVELGKALATNPKLLLLDEVASGLNPAEQGKMLNLIRTLHSELGITILTVEHVMQTVMTLARRIIVLNEGRILEIGSPEVVSSSEKVIKAYLGDEYEITSS